VTREGRRAGRKTGAHLPGQEPAAYRCLLPLGPPHLCAEHSHRQRTLSSNRIDRHVPGSGDSAFLFTVLAYQGYLSPLVLRRGVHSVEIWLRGCLKTGDRVEKRHVGKTDRLGKSKHQPIQRASSAAKLDKGLPLAA
jgi:hypothetical protein